MFEFLPGAKPTDAPKVKAKRLSMDEAVQQQRQAERQAKREKDETTVFDGIGASAVKGGVGFVDRFVQSLKYDPDPGFRLPENFTKDMEDWGIDESQWPLMAKAVNEDHYVYLKTLALQNQDADKALSQFGVMANIGLSLTDPVNFAVDAATGGLGYAAKAGRLANAARAGTTAAVVNTGLQAGSAQYDPTVTLADMATTAATSFAFAGALGARRGSKLELDAHVDPDAVQRLARDENLSAAKVGGLPEDRMPGIMPLSETAAEQARIDKAYGRAHLMPAFATVRRDLAARMGKMKSPLLREAGRSLFRDGVGYTDRSIAVDESTVEMARRHAGVLETQYRRGLNAAWKSHAQRNGYRWWQYGARAQFSEEVGKAVRGVADVSPEAKKAAQGVAETLRKAKQLASESNLDGFDFISDNPNYLPRYWSSKGFRRLFDKDGLGLDADQVREGLIKPAMRRAWEKNLDEGEEIDEELLEGVSKAYLKRAQANFEGDGMSLMVKPLDAADVDELAEMLKEVGVSATRSAELLAKLDRKTYEAGKLDRAKKRIDLDETYEATLTNAAGVEVKVGMYDLFDNDVEAVMSRYTREITGWSALSSKLGIRNKSQLDRYMNQLKVDAQKAGDDVKDVERLLDIGVKATFGRSTEVDPNSKASRWANVLRRWNFARVMNQVGFSLFAELGPSIAHAGLRNFMSSTWAAKDFLMRAADGSLPTKEARIVEELFAPGTDWLRNPPFLRLDEDGAIQPVLGNSKLARGFDNALNLANHATGVASGMAPINTMLQRIAGRATLLRLMDMANSAKLSSAEVARLRSWGLGEKEQAAVFAALKGKKKIDQIDVDALDFQTRERMSAFLYRVTRHQVLEGDPADSIELMHSWGGKLLTQFRSFMVNSYSRHFLNSAHHYDDWRTYVMVTLSTAAAGVGWAARTYINTIGDEEARTKQLTEENLYKNAIAQSSWSTFGPALTDMIWSDMNVGLAFGGDKDEDGRADPIFAGNRSTGLDNGIMGIPTVDLINKVYGSTDMPAAILSDDVSITEKEARDFWRIFWFNNMTGVRNLANEAIEHGFPDKQDGTDND